MSAIFEQAVSTLQNLPPDRRDELSRVIIDAAMPTIEFTAVENTMLDEGIAAADAGRFADPVKVEAFFAQHRA